MVANRGGRLAAVEGVQRAHQHRPQAGPGRGPVVGVDLVVLGHAPAQLTGTSIDEQVVAALVLGDRQERRDELPGPLTGRLQVRVGLTPVPDSRV